MFFLSEPWGLSAPPEGGEPWGLSAPPDDVIMVAATNIVLV